jgi:hypothetical protein
VHPSFCQQVLLSLWIHAVNLTPNIFFPNALAFFMLFLDPNSTQSDTRFGLIQKIKKNVKNASFFSFLGTHSEATH